MILISEGNLPVSTVLLEQWQHCSTLPDNVRRNHKSADRSRPLPANP